jgi:hypothetical protein
VEEVGAELRRVRRPLDQARGDQRVHQRRDVGGLDPQLLGDGAGAHARVGDDQGEHRESRRRDAEAGELLVELVEGAELREAHEEGRAARERRGDGPRAGAARAARRRRLAMPASGARRCFGMRPAYRGTGRAEKPTRRGRDERRPLPPRAGEGRDSMDTNQATRRATLAALAAARELWPAAAARRQQAADAGPPRPHRHRLPARRLVRHGRAALRRALAGLYAPQIVVENRAGRRRAPRPGGGEGRAPDGTTLVQTPASMLTVYPHIYPRTLRYDALADFVPVTPVCFFPFALAVRADHPAKTFPEFVEWAKRQGGAVPFASPAAGAVPHFLGVQMAKALGLQLTHVPTAAPRRRSRT